MRIRVPVGGPSKSSKFITYVALFSLLQISLVSHAEKPTVQKGKSEAQAGTASGGGGAKLESAFRLRGYQLISRIATTPSANTLCSADIMRAGLEGSKIRIMPVLQLPPEVNQDLDAWTVPGDIQLLKSTWSEYLSDYRFDYDQGSINALILHEIYRSTGICDDEGQKISGKILKLLKDQPKSFSAIYTFRSAIVFGEEMNIVTCERANANLSFGEAGTCLEVADKYSHYLKGIRFGSGQTYAYSETSLGSVRAKLQSGKSVEMNVSAATILQLTNLLKYVAPGRPLYFVYDFQTNTVSYGFDMNNLIQAN